MAVPLAPSPTVVVGASATALPTTEKPMADSVLTDHASTAQATKTDPPRRLEAVVITWNSARVLGGLLDSLIAGLDGLDWHLTVADNASADATAQIAEAWLAKHPQVRGSVLSTGRNAGYAGAINYALERAEPYHAALILNPDIRLEPDCGRRLMELLQQEAGTGIAVPRILEHDGSLAYSLRREPSVGRALGEAVLGRRAGKLPWFGEVILDEAAYQAPLTVDWATGAIMMLSAECVAACGLWDESFFLYSEETEYALRARDQGFATRFTPEAAAVHLGGERRSLGAVVDTADAQPGAVVPAAAFCGADGSVLGGDAAAGGAARGPGQGAEPGGGGRAADVQAEADGRLSRGWGRFGAVVAALPPDG